ncbi:unnamed protein product [Cyprideis torosa]|uniref:Uncharacterized protein n=1 Tax=Cyprideis torosa TaxID=163714 RepID=A0A7R8ZPQ4_9CRUS|nr:unnamed protein product [Cyprideis torosa]CAG0890371.1 unnamed protein product [Cyprideis torosa]
MSLLKMPRTGSASLSKRERDEMRKKQEEEEATAKAYAEFVTSFTDAPGKGSDKVWIKAGTFNAGNRSVDLAESGKLYKPSSKFAAGTQAALSAEKARAEAEIKASASGPPMAKRPEKPGAKKKVESKKKSNLELFKEELKLIQEERQERRNMKGALKDSGSIHTDKALGSGLGLALDETEPSPPSYSGSGSKPAPSYDVNNALTTNIYLGNISPKMTETQLMEIFGKYGPLASIKIMWPRTQEERERGKNCGFVAFMTRRDAERALKHLDSKEFQGFEMRLGWGKAVPLPQQPVYMPPHLLKLTLPPPPSGLPFNAQPIKEDRDELKRLIPTPTTPFPEDKEGREKLKEESSLSAVSNAAPFGLFPSFFSLPIPQIMKRAVVKVVAPAERPILHMIHRMVEFVIREGPMFEAMIMNREINNPTFRFLFENQSAAHVYYRWKLFSMLQGDSTAKWSTEPFRMFKDGPIWKPPSMNPFVEIMEKARALISDSSDSDSDSSGSDGERRKRSSVASGAASSSSSRGRRGGRRSPEVRGRKAAEKSKKGTLSNSQRDKLEDLLRGLTPEKQAIGDAMVWCIDHADAAEEICECIQESLSILNTPLHKKIARLYLVSDILHNCTVKVSNASFFRKGFEKRLESIFKSLNEKWDNIESRMKAEAFKQKVMCVLRAWQDWALYPVDILISIQNVFLGLSNQKGDSSPAASDEDLDGRPLLGPSSDTGVEEDDIDGVPLDGSALLRNAMKQGVLGGDLDGQRLSEDESTPSVSKKKQMPPGFVPSKWETVDPEEVQKQASIVHAVTTSKWEIFSAPVKNDADEMDIDGDPMDEDKSPLEASGSKEMSEEERQKLREIELKVMEYQDELEAEGNSALQLHEEVEKFRKKLLKKMQKEMRDSSRRSSRSVSHSPPHSSSRKDRRRKRSRRYE